MDIEHSYATRLIKGTDKDNYDSTVYLAESDVATWKERTVVIAGREASVLTLLLSGRKLKEFEGAYLIGLFEEK